MRKAAASVLALALAFIGVAPVSALTDTATVGVTVDLPLTATLSTSLDANSACPSADEIVFDLLDSEDAGVTGPSAFFAYQPPRSAVNKNCHLIDIHANGSSMTLSAEFSGQAPNLSVFFGGFFAAIPGDNNKGGQSGDWESVSGFSRVLNEPFIGIAPVNYRIGDGFTPLTAGLKSGTITWTLVSN